MRIDMPRGAGAVLCLLLAVAIVAPAQARRHTAIYRGKLPHGGTIRVDVSGTRATVRFLVDCQGEELGSGVAEVNYEPLSAHLRGGRLSIDESELGETHNETSGAPQARIRIQAHVGSRELTGVFSIAQEAGASLFPGEAGTGTPACSTGRVRFVARRALRSAT